MEQRKQCSIHIDEGTLHAFITNRDKNSSNPLLDEISYHPVKEEVTIKVFPPKYYYFEKETENFKIEFVHANKKEIIDLTNEKEFQKFFIEPFDSLYTIETKFSWKKFKKQTRKFIKKGELLTFRHYFWDQEFTYKTNNYVIQGIN